MKIKYISILVIFILAQNSVFSQNSSYLVKFKDKQNSQYSLERPHEFLSPQSIERRNALNISLDSSDLPVSSIYIKSLVDLGATPIFTSKWINSVTIKVEDDSLISILEQLDFVEKPIERTFSDLKQNNSHTNNKNIYGRSFEQIDMLNGHYLHNSGYDGSNIIVAVIDAGFYKVDEMKAFADLQNENRIIYTWDFVENEANVYDDGPHGQEVLSCMAAQLKNKYIGTSPDANYVLIRTENSKSEFPIEEDAFIAGLELADSLGVRLINTSLGYSTFDDSSFHHTYKDMDGSTLRISIASQMATEKGIVVVTSAGNEGYNSWQKITAPSDAKDVITVGAVDVKSNYAIFSSKGPSFDNRIKPELVALGFNAQVIGRTGEKVKNASGSSYSSPILAGMIASLLEAYPEASVQNIRKALIHSGSNYSSPNNYVGYGYPDFGFAFLLLNFMSQDSAMADHGIYGYSINDYSDLYRFIFYPSETGMYSISFRQGLFYKYDKKVNVGSDGWFYYSIPIKKTDGNKKIRLKIKNLESDEKYMLIKKSKEKIYITPSS